MSPIAYFGRIIRISGVALLLVAQWSCRSDAPRPSVRSNIQTAIPPIDRHALVTRHNIFVHNLDPMGAMAVGNGDFAFNFDVTGLQSFPEYYARTMPIGILSTWGWHSFPNPKGYSIDTFPMTKIKKYDRYFVFPSASTSHPTAAAAYLRTNPQRIGLGRIGLEMTHANGSPVAITDLKDIDEELDLWSGIATSSFTVDGIPVVVVTAAHPNRSEIAVSIDSPLIQSGQLKVRLAYPYASTSFGPDYQDWNHPDAHATVLTTRGDTGADFARTLDDTHYYVRALWSPGAALTQTSKHQYLLTGSGDHLELTAWFSPTTLSPDTEADTVASVQSASRQHWRQYWSTGGAIDLSGNSDPRAAELERRIVLSEYVMAVHDAGDYPPQETGLGVNSWYGKFHMEMYWWHAAHWALWGRPEILEKSLDHLPQMMPPGQAMAKLEGCKGVKWSKMTDPSGNESPSGVGPALVWQQPHPIYLCELDYRARRDRATLEKYKDIVFQTADYMATFVDFDPKRKQYVLGPGIQSGDEKHLDYAHNLNPTMELGYWKWALEIAQQWRIRLGMAPDPLYDKVIKNLAPLTVRNGIYPALERPVEDRPGFMSTWLGGIIPTEGLDKEAMRNTLHAVANIGGVQASITWGTAMYAMCAARLGESDNAIDLLVGKYEKNPFMVSGYTVRRPEQTPMYMPANGGWLSAVAMMAAGWDGSTGYAPGFPKDWKVKYEGLLPMP
jgi:protein-glucosylgalactosylhydroxylysine glucosidase